MNYTELTLKAVELLAPVLLALLSYLSVMATKWIGAKVDNEYLSGALERLNGAVHDAVKELQQTTVAEIKLAAEDGMITKEEAAEIKQHAIDGVKEYLGAKGIAALEKILGKDALEKMIKAKIEAFLHDLKVNGRRADSLLPSSE